MTIEFKVTVDSTVDSIDQNELLPYTNAIERDSFLFELFNNFFRTYKYLEEDPSLDKIKEDLYQLKEQYKVIIE
jgi:hypothetical protein